MHKTTLKSHSNSNRVTHVVHWWTDQANLFSWILQIINCNWNILNFRSCFSFWLVDSQ